MPAYASVLPNLRKHNANYPAADSLRHVMRVGNENIDDLYVAPPEMKTQNTAGEQLIMDTLLDSDPRPVHVLFWGGRSVYDDPKSPKHLTDKEITDDGDRNNMYRRWVPAAQNDFAARMDWCVKHFEDANHPPIIKVSGDHQRNVKPGETVTLVAEVSDPDGDNLSCRWWQYADADSAAAAVTISNSDSPDGGSFVVPNEPGKQIHIILEVSDSGTPPRVRYQRTICNIE